MHGISAQSRTPLRTSDTRTWCAPAQARPHRVWPLAQATASGPRAVISTCGGPPLLCHPEFPDLPPSARSAFRRAVPGPVSSAVRAVPGRGGEAHQEPGRPHQREGREQRQRSQGPWQGWCSFLRGARRWRRGVGWRCSSHSAANGCDWRVLQTLHNTSPGSQVSCAVSGNYSSNSWTGARPKHDTGRPQC